MTTLIKKYAVLFVVLSIISCSKEKEVVEITEEAEIPIEKPTLLSFSKNFGNTGDIITLNGTGFNSDKDKVEVSFDGISAEIVSITDTKIEIKLPLLENGIPELEVKIDGVQSESKVENDYDGNLGVLAKVQGEWAYTKTDALKGYKALNRQTQLISPEKIYLTVTTGANSNTNRVLRSLDGGLTYNQWVHQGFNNTFYVNEKGNGWSEAIGLRKVTSNDDNTTSDEDIWNTPDNSNSAITGIWVDQELMNGIVVTQRKKAYRTSDGGLNFEEIYDGKTTQIIIDTFFALDKNHLWTGGRYGALLFTLDGGENWNDLKPDLDIEMGGDINKIQFLDKDNGYVLNNRSYEHTLKNLSRTSDGGFTWTRVTDQLPTSDFVFETIEKGWSFKGNKIYVTNDGGVTWEENFSADSPILKVSVKDDAVIAFTENGILRYFN